MIYPPLADDDENRAWYSVGVNFPAEKDAAIRAFVAEDECSSWTFAIHGALYGYRATIWSEDALRIELQTMIDAGMRDVEAGRTIEVTPAFWKDLRRSSAAAAKRIDRLQAEGALGNLLLPRELYEFVVSEIKTSKFRTPTEVVCAAMPYLSPPQPASSLHLRQH